MQENHYTNKQKNYNNQKKGNNTGNDMSATLEALVQSQKALTEAVETLVSSQMNNNQQYAAYPMFLPVNPYMQNFVQKEVPGDVSGEIGKEQVDNRIKQLENENKLLKEKLSNVKEQKSSVTVAETLKLEQENTELKQVLEQCKKENTSYSKEIENLSSELLDKQQQCEKLHNLENTVKQYKNAISEKDKEISGLQKEKQNLQKEYEQYKNAYEEKGNVEVSGKENQAEIENLKKEIEKLQAEYRDMENIAYTDAKTDRKNANAFNMEFPEVSLANSVLGIVAIEGLESINLEYGKESGDGAIVCVSEILGKYFDDTQVYRTMGGQFFVVAKNEEQKRIHKILEEIKQKLLEVQEISVTIATVATSDYATHRDVIAGLDEIYIKAKNGNVQKFSDTNEYNDIPDAVETEAYDQIDLEDEEDDEVGEMREQSGSIKDMTESYLFGVVADYVSGDND